MSSASTVPSQFPLAKIYVKTPSIWEIMIYYIFVFIISFLYKVKNDKTPNNSFLRVRWILAYIKYKYKIKKLEREGKQSRENIGKHTPYFRKT